VVAEKRRINMDNIRLIITRYDDNSIMCEAVRGIEHFGFGTFLCNIKPEEIKCDAFSKSALLMAIEKDGLNGMEIWVDNRIAWSAPNHKIIMPLCEISKQQGSNVWLEQLKSE
jgi:hypothetical protein